MIIQRITVGAWRANCYIVASEKEKTGFLLDPGDRADTILEAVEKTGCRITLIALTHGHIDHIGATGRLKKALGNIPVAIHTDDSTALQGDERYFWGQTYGPPIKPDRLLEDGNVITAGEYEFKVISTPGHTGGCICLYGDGVLFTGDTLFRHRIGSSGFGTGTRSELIDSIKTRLMVLPAETVIYPGHGNPSTIGEEKIHNPYL